MAINVNDCADKDKQAQEFIKAVNPYSTKPSLGIDMRSLAKYAKANKRGIRNQAACLGFG